MKNTKNVVVKKACHSRFCRPQDSGIYNACRYHNKGKNLLNKYVEDPRLRLSGMTPNLMGFTLIELLVVVLIIGILAAVAVPQYQKAVKKARLAEFISTSASITKAIDVWLLNNGYPDDYVWFSGKGDTSKTYSSLDIDLLCTKENSSYCYNHLGGWQAYCLSTSCGINLYTNRDKNGGTTNTWLNGAFLSLRKRPSDEDIWKMESVTQNTKLVCEAWKNSFGTEHMRDSLKETCASLGIQ